VRTLSLRQARARGEGEGGLLLSRGLGRRRGYHRRMSVYGARKEVLMSHRRVLICQVQDETEQMTELASVDLPPVPGQWADAPLPRPEAQVATAGQRLLGRLCGRKRQVSVHAGAPAHVRRGTATRAFDSWFINCHVIR